TTLTVTNSVTRIKAAAVNTNRQPLRLMREPRVIIRVTSPAGRPSTAIYTLDTKILELRQIFAVLLKHLVHHLAYLRQRTHGSGQRIVGNGLVHQTWIA